METIYKNFIFDANICQDPTMRMVLMEQIEYESG